MSDEATFPGIGMISEGTLRPQDLIPTFLDVLRKHDPRQRRAEQADTSEGFVAATPIPYEAWEDEDHGWWESEEASEFLSEVMDNLDELCPPFVHFGTTGGDGALYGLWPEVEMAAEDPYVAKLQDCGRLGGGTCLNGEALDDEKDWEEVA
ncbi:hypothetical protein, partial [Thiohalorhabdus sp.]|uniref:hypothetical protein n=1 Tax=Thiohalorhabdus sp. TaxID=3094134 RepID=UPI002FC376E4